MKKIFKVLIIILLFMAVKVHADSINNFMIDPEYTTLVKGDEIDLKIGFDGYWNTYLLEDIVDSKTKKFNDMFLIFDGNTFDIDLSEMKTIDKEYIMDSFKYSKFTGGIGETIVWFRDIYLNTNTKYTDDTSDDVLVSDGKMDNVLFSNIKLKVKDTAKEGSYGFVSGYISTYEKMEMYETLPISVIEKETNEKTLKRLLYYSHDFKLEKNKNYYIYDVNTYFEDNKNEYFMDNDIKYNLICTDRCKANNIGSSAYQIYSSDGSDEIEIEFGNNNYQRYIIDHEIEYNSFNYNWYNNLDKLDLILTISDEYNGGEDPSYKDKISEHLNSEVDYFEYYVRFSDLNDTDKKIIKALVDENYDGKEDTADVYVLEKGKMTYHYTESIKKDIHPPYTKGKIYDYTNMYIILGFALLAVIVIVLVIILNKKNKELKNIKGK